MPSTITIDLNKKTYPKFNTFSAELIKLGYSRESMVLEPGDFSIRGGIIDVFPNKQSHPIRIEYFDDVIDRLNTFSTSNQRSLSELSKIKITAFDSSEKSPFKLDSATIEENEILSEFKEGDYIVHENYGIGIYRGLKRLQLRDFEGEYIFIEYKGGDKVYVPINKISLLHKYSAGETKPRITKLHDGSWQKTIKKAKSAVILLAQEVYENFKNRMTRQGFSCAEDTENQILFENDFAYTPTPDQEKAISQIKEDMQAEKPMERLLCGDVGYGKTEVLLRAAFKAVENNKQVAIVAPTTILAQQHYRTVMERMEKYPFRVEVLSRFVKKERQNEIIKDLKTQKVDIVIGTHRLLQKDISFADLGLLIIDEEQRFGVKHKERLKTLAPDVDIISVSATPIPRTLYMALTGARDLSNIQTPPKKRKPVLTSIQAFDLNIIKNVIDKEVKRNGKVYYLYNHVQNITQKYSELKSVLPDVNIVIEHGQMSKNELNTAMDVFQYGDGQVLLCSTIIENGLDIPEAGTIIIEQIHKFGLSQIHQLRGRVGRSAAQGYAYFFYDAFNTLSEDAQKRLHAVKEFTSLGAGYKLALKDLEIRGAGSLLGNAQSGHMTAVGFDLYCQLLEDTINLAKGIHKESKASILKEEFAVIPESYIPNQRERLNIYQRLEKIQTMGQLFSLRAECEDRFGPIPELVDLIFETMGREIKAVGACG